MNRRKIHDLPALEELECIHESDRTKQQNRWLEIRRLHKMNGKDKIIYILTYHKAAIAGLMVLLIDTAYISVMANVQNTEAAAEWIRYLIQK